MKRFKRIIGMLLAMVMVLGMSMAAFASETPDPGNPAPATGSATITINNAENATLTYKQIVKANPAKTTGWEIIDADVESSLIDALNVAGADDPEQAVLAKWIAKEITPAQMNAALGKVTDHAPFANGSTVTEAGVYAINATEEGYTYTHMAAYVGFGEQYPTLANAELDAKKSSTSVEKDVTTENDDEISYIGESVTYTITAHVPYFNANETNKTFKITDSIDGAVYDLVTKAEVTLEGYPDKTLTQDAFIVNEAGNGFEIDLSSYIDVNNIYAGKTVTVTYNAIITELTAENTAKGHIGDKEFDSDPVYVYTGDITLTKVDADEKADNGDYTKMLEGAEFNVFEEGSNTALKFVKVSDGEYKYAPTDESATATVVTGSKGTLKVTGLDVGKYEFEETKAPTGYSKVETRAKAEIKATEAELSVEIEGKYFTNTKLASLPATGGIGTYIFTIAGILIMAAAAGFFFVSRRKADC